MAPLMTEVTSLRHAIFMKMVFVFTLAMHGGMMRKATEIPVATWSI